MSINSDIYGIDQKWRPQNPVNYQVAGVASDCKGHLLVLTRGDNDWFPKVGFRQDTISCDPVLVLDEETGMEVRRWGKNKFVMPHQIRVDAEGSIWIVDCGAHKVFKFDENYNLLLELGGLAVGFNMPTDVAVMKDGSFLVSDGYVNARIAYFEPGGKLISSWGEKGNGPREFRIPHSLVLDHVENIFVADRENDRIQIFDKRGTLLDIWPDIENPSTLFVSGGSLFVLSHLAAEKGIVREVDLSSGNILTEFPTMPLGLEGDYEWPHGVQVSSDKRNIYIGYTLTAKTIRRFVRRML